MKKVLLFVFSLCALRLIAAAPVDIEIFNDGTERAVLHVFPAEKSSGKAIVCCPGGGYAMRAMEHEGYAFVPWLNEQGITLGVLEYRLPAGRDTVPGNDARRAVALMRERGAEWGVDKVGIMGFSAGGHLASTVATHCDPATRPDFQILFYPVVSMDAAITHAGSRENLIGPDPSAALVELYSNEKQVSADTPEAIIFHSSDDTVVPVENTLGYYRALTAAGVPASMHIFATGGHGWGFNDAYTYKPVWTAILADWLSRQ
ncbi:MAG: alpha/beta hydrolase [Muribaculaceae bacterium]|nr:alpha/beta hydrolase [Muribaculaceae bacterium]